ncbi:MAG: hypothetical protein AB8B99_17625 [Phormidesmis sp.]
MSSKERNTFSLNLKTQKVVSFIEEEKSKASKSKTSFINELLECLADCSVVLTSQSDGSSMLDELDAMKTLLDDDVIQNIPYLASMTRRDPVQMLLHLVEKGIEADDQLSSIYNRGDLEHREKGNRFNRRRSDIENPLRESSSVA